MDIPSLFMIPSAVSSGKVHSVFPNSTDADFQFNRDSDATRVNSEGLIERVGYYGSELVTNGGFDSASGWNLNTNWTINNGVASCDGTNSNDINQSQNVGVIGKSYRISFTIVSISQGGIAARIGSGITNYYTEAGTYTEIVTATSTDRIRVSVQGNAIASIDNLSIKEVTGDRARLNYEIEGGLVNTKPSLLLEPQSTNRFLYSEDLTQYNLSSTGTNSSNPIITSNYAISPDGTRNADRVQFNAGTDSSGNSRITETFTIFGTTETISVYLKSNDGQEHTIDIIQSNQPQDTVTVTSEWQRFSFTRVNSSPDKYGIGLTGSNAETADILAWGFQLEQLSYATSYIPTNGSTQTRAAETCFGAGTSSMFSNTEGILYMEFADLYDGDNPTFRRYCTLSDGTTNNVVRITKPSSGTNQISYAIRIGGSAASSQIKSVTNIKDFNKVAIYYKSGNTKFYLNGVKESVVSATYTMFQPTTLSFGQWNGNTLLHSKCRDIRVYNTKEMTDSEVDILLTKITS